jgi:hypothetical protein
VVTMRYLMRNGPLAGAGAAQLEAWLGDQLQRLFDGPAPPRLGDRPAPPRLGERPAPPRLGERPAPPRLGDRPATARLGRAERLPVPPGTGR